MDQAIYESNPIGLEHSDPGTFSGSSRLIRGEMDNAPLSPDISLVQTMILSAIMWVGLIYLAHCVWRFVLYLI